MGKKSNKYNISEEKADEFKSIIRKFGRSSIETEKLFDLFTEWQSLKTRSLKRFVLTLSFLLSLAYFIEMDISAIKPLGLNVENANQTAFLIALMIIHVSTLFYYLYQRSVDLNVREAKVSYFTKDLGVFLAETDAINEFIKEKKIPSYRVLVREVNDGVSYTKFQRQAEKVYEAVCFFKEKLKKEKSKTEWGERGELCVIIGLGVLGLITIICSF